MGAELSFGLKGVEALNSTGRAGFSCDPVFLRVLAPWGRLASRGEETARPSDLSVGVVIETVQLRVRIIRIMKLS